MSANTRRHRPGVAAVELVVVLPFMLILIVGLWEVARVVMVQNVLDNAAREGARLAASAAYFSSANTKDPTTTLNIPLVNSQDSSGNPITYDVQKRVLVYLTAANLSTTGATVKVENLDKSWSGTWTGSTSTGSSSGTYDPAAAADQLNHLRVTVTLPYSSVQWSTVNMFVPSSLTLTAVVDIYSLRNVPFTVSTSIPQTPS